MANIAITLPIDLWQKILSGEKSIELRKSFPQRYQPGVDKCFVIIKGTDEVVGHFVIGNFQTWPNTDKNRAMLAQIAGVPATWLEDYYKTSDNIYSWEISEVYEYFSCECRNLLLRTFHNPQSYIYVEQIVRLVQTRRIW